MFFIFLCFLLVIWLFKSSSDHSTEVLTIGPMYQNAVMCLLEEIPMLLVELQSVSCELRVHESTIWYTQREEQEIHQSV